MSLSVGDSLRMAVLGWQSECALRNRSDLANGFAVPARCTLPATAEECVELGRSMLRVHLASESENREAMAAAAATTGVVVGEITPVVIPTDHVHTIDSDLSIDGCAGCDSLKKKWREDQIAKERARRDRLAETLVAKARHLQDINTRGGQVDAGLLQAVLVADVINDVGDLVVNAINTVESRLDKIEDRLINIASACYGEGRDGR